LGCGSEMRGIFLSLLSRAVSCPFLRDTKKAIVPMRRNAFLMARKIKRETDASTQVRQIFLIIATHPLKRNRNGDSCVPSLSSFLGLGKQNAFLGCLIVIDN